MRIYSFPIGLIFIIEKLKLKKWLLSSFVIDDINLLNPSNFLENIEKDNIEYILILDRNLFHFILSAYKKEYKKDIYREAIGLVAFCFYSKIKIEFSLPLYEKINYSKENISEVMDEMALFYRIDDTPDPESLINFALNERDDFIVNLAKKDSENTLIFKEWFDKYKKLIEWDSMYLIILKLVDLSLTSKNTKEKFTDFIQWVHSEFRYSLIGVVYAIFLFSSKRKKKMMKYKQNASVSNKKSQIYNMTWDLYLMNDFFRQQQEKNDKQEFLFASDDSLILDLMRYSIEVNKAKSIDVLKKYLIFADHFLVDKTNEMWSSKNERQFQGNTFKKPEQRELLIKELESRLYL